MPYFSVQSTRSRQGDHRYRAQAVIGLSEPDIDASIKGQQRTEARRTRLATLEEMLKAAISEDQNLQPNGVHGTPEVQIKETKIVVSIGADSIVVAEPLCRDLARCITKATNAHETKANHHVRA